MGLLSAMAGVWLTGGDNNIFTQIGLVVLVGLAGQERDPDRRVRARAGVRRHARRCEAAIEACRLRLRPILMTSLAFIMGVVPLVISTGAGAEMRARHGRRRVLRHDRRDAVRPLPDAGVLRAAAPALAATAR